MGEQEKLPREEEEEAHMLLPHRGNRVVLAGEARLRVMQLAALLLSR